MNEKMKGFLHKLAMICDEYKAELWCSRDDDGVLITIDGETVSIGWPSGPNPGDDIRKFIQ
jgi:hypothetical protein